MMYSIFYFILNILSDSSKSTLVDHLKLRTIVLTDLQYLASLIAQLVKNPPATAMQETWVPSLGREKSTEEGIGYPLQYSWASVVAQLVKNLPVIWETWVQSLGWEDLLEKRMASHSSILAWRIPWTIWFMGSQRVRLSNFYFHIHKGS